MKREEKTKSAKEKIIKGAFSLFATKGYEATTTQDIIDITRLSRGAMYHHFKSKQEILESVTKEAQLQVNVFFEGLVADDSLTAKEKISKIITYTANNDVQKQLIHYSWIEKIPFALLDEIRNLNNIIAPFVSQIIKQGVDMGEFQCSYPKELAEILALCIDVWLDPVLFKRSFAEVSSRLDFLLFMLEKIGTPIIEEEDMKRIKDLYKPFLDEGIHYGN
ncbi:TetR/AcrR family transcriptional regulator [Anaerocolumna xylanovorans]|uniref:Transcriptional regulator, TetR family n=1 Tax=Anaerocolumna xylanovorans DSM 12503 TaxID=1121345 RepID=A0A1M7YIJ9_9FIRM|nr:TetR/AcrR family transcriptional regulator [Anaerocolumna xylanovorans]SHO52431.1 transcriptional regulator, TetR family [Anaerocolumna xylanovorans DSM 12503]